MPTSVSSCSVNRACVCIVLADVEEKAQEVINKRVEHEITRILNGYGG